MLPETFLIHARIQSDIIINVNKSSCTICTILAGF